MSLELFALFLPFAPARADLPRVPVESGYVFDYAEMLTAEQETALATLGERCFESNNDATPCVGNVRVWAPGYPDPGNERAR